MVSAGNRPFLLSVCRLDAQKPFFDASPLSIWISFTSGQSDVDKLSKGSNFENGPSHGGGRRFEFGRAHRSFVNQGAQPNENNKPHRASLRNTTILLRTGGGGANCRRHVCGSGSPTFWPHAVEGLSFCPRISSDHHTRRIPSRTVSIIAANVPLSCVFVNPR